MLMSIVVLEVVGGALAFKAKFDIRLCTMHTVNQECPENPGTWDCPVDPSAVPTLVGELVCYTDAGLADENGFCDPSECTYKTFITHF